MDEHVSQENKIFLELLLIILHQPPNKDDYVGVVFVQFVQQKLFAWEQSKKRQMHEM